MASHGRRGIAAIVLGSETVKVLAIRKIPVLVHDGDHGSILEARLPMPPIASRQEGSRLFPTPGITSAAMRVAKFCFSCAMMRARSRKLGAAWDARTLSVKR